MRRASEKEEAVPGVRERVAVSVGVVRRSEKKFEQRLGRRRAL